MKALNSMCQVIGGSLFVAMTLLLFLGYFDGNPQALHLGVSVWCIGGMMFVLAHTSRPTPKR